MLIASTSLCFQLGNRCFLGIRLSMSNSFYGKSCLERAVWGRQQHFLLRSRSDEFVSFYPAIDRACGHVGDGRRLLGSEHLDLFGTINAPHPDSGLSSSPNDDDLMGLAGDGCCFLLLH